MLVKIERLTDPYRFLEAMRFTRGKRTADHREPSLALWRGALEARHSPIRAVVYRVYLYNVPYHIHVHLVRHHIGVQFYVQSQRVLGDDKRGKLPQDAPVHVMFDANAEALMNMASKRLCKCAAKEAQEAVYLVKHELATQGDDFDFILSDHMVPQCDRFARCVEMKSCGMWPKG